MIKPLEGAKALLFEVCQLAKELSCIKNFGSAFLEDFIEVKRKFIEVKGNHTFLDEYLILDNESDQDLD